MSEAGTPPDESAMPAGHEQRQQKLLKLAAIGQLAIGVTHDFNNLLAVIESGLRLIQRQLLVHAADPKTTGVIDDIFTGIRRAESLAQQLLSFSRRHSLMPQPTDVNALIRSLLPLIEWSLGKGVRIQQSLDPVDSVFIDATQLEVAILNLAINARDAMDGYGTLTVETRNDAGSAAEPDAASFIRLTVRDTGRGMTAETLARVTEPFFSTKEEGQGTGLGLNQVHTLVAHSGGRLHIESEAGQGTRVHLLLPRINPLHPDPA